MLLGLSVRRTPTTRAMLFVAGDLLIWAGSLYAAFLVRFDGAIPSLYLSRVPVLLAVLLPIKLTWQIVYRLHALTWRSVGLSEIINVAKAGTLALLTITAVTLGLRGVDAFASFPRSVMLLDYVFGMCGVAIFRMGRRAWQIQRRALLAGRKRNGVRLLIVGAGSAGIRTAQTIQESGGNAYALTGFIDDDPAKRGIFINGLKVFGPCNALPAVAKKERIQEVLIAIPSARPMRLREIIEKVREAGVQRVKVLPDLHEWMAGRVSLKDLSEVNLPDLIGRPPMPVQHSALAAYFAGKRVLVTGAAGSIGSELVRQLAQLKIDQVIAADTNESGLFELESDLAKEVPGAVLRTTITDVRDGPKLDWLMKTTRPHLVFHAAAYKHVPMMEREAEEAVKTNVFGTLLLGEAACRHGVQTFVLISSDKAANAVSVMGASKRVGELIVQALDRRGQGRFLTVRFGNVLGSRGSLVSVLRDQIRKGGPVTITHPEMVRYFMTISEAVLLVLHTPLLPPPSNHFMLDMGEPISIVDLARRLIRLSGLQDDADIPIVFSGMRPGEKLREELLMAHEQAVPTTVERIMEIRSTKPPDEITLRLVLRELERLVQANDSSVLGALLRHLAQPPAELQPAVLGALSKA